MGNRKEPAVATKLQQELKKKRGFESPQQEAVLAMLRTSDRTQTELVRLFREFSLTPSQYNILRILRGEGAPLPILEIASRTITVVPGITGLVDRLEKAGLVSRTRCKDDRRVIYIALTSKASAVLKQSDAPLEKMHQRLMQGLSAAEVKQLTQLLDKVRAAMSDEEDSEM